MSNYKLTYAVMYYNIYLQFVKYTNSQKETLKTISYESSLRALTRATVCSGLPTLMRMLFFNSGRSK